MALEVRTHGDWKAFDWLWLGVFYLAASVVARSWWKRYRTRFHTVSVFTGTIYSPMRAPALPGGTVYVHESVHMRQRKRLGLFPFVWKYLTREGRFQLELEAYAKDGRGLAATQRALTPSNYLLWGWSEEETLARIAELWDAFRVIREPEVDSE